jgi:hypothetical protein
MREGIPIDIVHDIYDHLINRDASVCASRQGAGEYDDAHQDGDHAEVDFRTNAFSRAARSSGVHEYTMDAKSTTSTGVVALSPSEAAWALGVISNRD